MREMKMRDMIMGKCYATVGVSTFFRGQVSTGGDDTALLFTTDTQLQLLHDSHVIYIDSTFKVVPALYYQLFTIFVPHADYSFPVCYALMTRKTTALYRAVLERLHQLAPLFAPTQLIADFEDAPAAAFRAVFGEQLQISGCWFRYAHSVIRRMKKTGTPRGIQDAGKDTVGVSMCSVAPSPTIQ